MPKGLGKITIKSVMGKFKKGQLHSGGPQGPKVTNPKQAIAIGISEGYPGGMPGSPPPKLKHHKGGSNQWEK